MQLHHNMYHIDMVKERPLIYDNMNYTIKMFIHDQPSYIWSKCLTTQFSYK